MSIITFQDYRDVSLINCTKLSNESIFKKNSGIGWFILLKIVAKS